MAPAVPSASELFADAPCGLLVAALDGTILKINSTFCRWLDMPQEELVGVKRLQDLLTVGGKIFHQTHWVPMLQLQGSISEIKLDLRRQDGQVFPAILNAQRRKRAEGDFDEIAAFTAQDRHRYEHELLNARRKANELLEVEQKSLQLLRDRALFAEQMVGIVSHDLRNPLSAILTGVQLLGRADSERRMRVLGHVRSSAERAQRLIEDLLDFTQARVGSGLSVSLRRIDLHELTIRTLEELRLAFPGRGIVHVMQGVGVCVADPDRLAQLIGNLVGNAAAYGGPSTPITVTSGIETHAMICVHNVGDPISASAIAHIFEPMVRGDTGSNAIRSVGLGLYIVNEIARAHQGTMTVNSSLEEGTTFELNFPAHELPPPSSIPDPVQADTE